MESVKLRRDMGVNVCCDSGASIVEFKRELSRIRISLEQLNISCSNFIT